MAQNEWLSLQQWIDRLGLTKQWRQMEGRAEASGHGEALIAAHPDEDGSEKTDEPVRDLGLRAEHS